VPSEVVGSRVVRDDVDDFIVQCVHSALQALAWARSTSCFPTSSRKR
jgi:hypothetical protein